MDAYICPLTGMPSTEVSVVSSKHSVSSTSSLASHISTLPGLPVEVSSTTAAQISVVKDVFGTSPPLLQLPTLFSNAGLSESTVMLVMSVIDVDIEELLESIRAPSIDVNLHKDSEKSNPATWKLSVDSCTAAMDLLHIIDYLESNTPSVTEDEIQIAEFTAYGEIDCICSCLGSTICTSLSECSTNKKSSIDVVLRTLLDLPPALLSPSDIFIITLAVSSGFPFLKLPVHENRVTDAWRLALFAHRKAQALYCKRWSLVCSAKEIQAQCEAAVSSKVTRQHDSGVVEVSDNGDSITVVRALLETLSKVSLCSPLRVCSLLLSGTPSTSLSHSINIHILVDTLIKSFSHPIGQRLMTVTSNPYLQPEEVTIRDLAKASPMDVCMSLDSLLAPLDARQSGELPVRVVMCALQSGTKSRWRMSLHQAVLFTALGCSSGEIGDTSSPNQPKGHRKSGVAYRRRSTQFDFFGSMNTGGRGALMTANIFSLVRNASRLVNAVAAAQRLADVFSTDEWDARARGMCTVGESRPSLNELALYRQHRLQSCIARCHIYSALQLTLQRMRFTRFRHSGENSGSNDRGGVGRAERQRLFELRMGEERSRIGKVFDAQREVRRREDISARESLTRLCSNITDSQSKLRNCVVSVVKDAGVFEENLLQAGSSYVSSMLDSVVSTAGVQRDIVNSAVRELRRAEDSASTVAARARDNALKHIMRAVYRKTVEVDGICLKSADGATQTLSDVEILLANMSASLSSAREKEAEVSILLEAMQARIETALLAAEKRSQGPQQHAGSQDGAGGVIRRSLSMATPSSLSASHWQSVLHDDVAAREGLEEAIRHMCVTTSTLFAEGKAAMVSARDMFLAGAKKCEVEVTWRARAHTRTVASGLLQFRSDTLRSLKTLLGDVAAVSCDAERDQAFAFSESMKKAQELTIPSSSDSSVDRSPPALFSIDVPTLALPSLPGIVEVASDLPIPLPGDQASILQSTFENTNTHRLDTHSTALTGVRDLVNRAADAEFSRHVCKLEEDRIRRQTEEVLFGIIEEVSLRDPIESAVQELVARVEGVEVELVGMVERHSSTSISTGRTLYEEAEERRMLHEKDTENVVRELASAMRKAFKAKESEATQQIGALAPGGTPHT